MASQYSEYLIYSSKVGLVFRQENGRFFVDKSYNYDVSDDIDSILRSNQVFEDKLTKATTTTWVRAQERLRTQSRRRLTCYEADFRVIANESAGVVPAQARAVLAGTATPVATASLVTAPRTATTSGSFKSTVIPPFDSQRKSTGGIPLFHTAARDELIRFLRGQSSSNGVVSSPTSDETLPTTQNNSEWLARGSGISESSPLVVPSDAVQIKVLYQLVGCSSFAGMKTMRLQVLDSPDVQDMAANCTIIRESMLQKFSESSEVGRKGALSTTSMWDVIVLFMDSEVDEFVYLETESWADFMSQKKKVLQASFVPSTGGHREEAITATVVNDAVGEMSMSDTQCAVELAGDSISKTSEDSTPSSPQVDVLNPVEVGGLIRSEWMPMAECGPEIDAELVSINGIKVCGLKWQVFCALMLQRSRPLLLLFRRRVKFVDHTVESRHLDDLASIPQPPLPAGALESGGGHGFSHVVDRTSLPQAIKKNVFRYETFEAKYNHPMAQKMRKRVESIFSSYLECDWKRAALQGTGKPQATVQSLYRYIESELRNLGLLDPGLPQGGGVPTMDDVQLSFLRNHIESFVMKSLGEFTLKLGPIGSEYESYASHRCRIGDNLKSCHEIVDNYSGDEDTKFHFATLRERLSFLSHLSPQDLGFDLSERVLSHGTASDPVSVLLGGTGGLPNSLIVPVIPTGRLAEEWYIAIRELANGCAGVRNSPSEIAHRLHSALQTATAAAERYFVSGSYNRLQVVDAPVTLAESSKDLSSDLLHGPPLVCRNLVRVPIGALSEALGHSLGADELLPIVTWLLIQANPPQIEAILWFCCEFRHPDLTFGHTNYSLTQLSSALEFVKSAGREELCPYSSAPTTRLDAALLKFHETQCLIDDCKRGVNKDTLARRLRNGADINGYSTDKTDTPLSAAVRHRKLTTIEFLLTHTCPLMLKKATVDVCIDGATPGAAPVLDVDMPLCPSYDGDPPYCSTALHLAVRLGDEDAVALLLAAGANRYISDSEGNTPLSLAIDFDHCEIQKLIIADPYLYNVDQATSYGSVSIVEGLLKQNIDVTKISAASGVNAIMSAVLMRNECMLSILLSALSGRENTATALNSTDSNDLTALMMCSKQISGPRVHYSIRDTEVDSEHQTRKKFRYYDAVFGTFKDYDDNDLLQMRLAVKLLKAGADVSFENINGMNAFVYSLLEGFEGPALTSPTPQNGTQPVSASSSSSVWAFMKSAASELLETVSGVVPRSDKLLDDVNVNTPSARNAMFIVKSIESATEKYGPEHLDAWWGSSRLAAVLFYTPENYKIYHCARDNCLHGVRALLDYGEDPNAQCPVEEYTALIASVYNANDRICDVLLADARTDLNICLHSSRAMTALHYAAAMGNTVLCGKLLWAGANRTALTTDGKLALDMAVEFGHKDTADVLNFDPDKVSISLAAKHGDIRVTKALLAQGVTINTKRNHYIQNSLKNQLYTPLIAAATYGQKNYITFLLELSGRCGNSVKKCLETANFSVSDELDVNAANPEGHTALMCAAMTGHEDVVLLLLDKGKANRDLCDNNHVTATEWASRRGYQSIYDILRYDPVRCSIHAFVSTGNMGACIALFKQNVDPNEHYVSALKPDRTAGAVSMLGIMDGETPLAVAARRNHMAILRLLLQAPDIQSNSRDSEGATPLGRAAEAGNEDAVLLLLKHGCSRVIADIRGNRPLDLALGKGHIGIAAILEADPELVNCSDLCAEGRVALVEGLLKQGVSPNHRDARRGKNSEPILVTTARCRRKQVFDLLLNTRGTDVNAVDSLGISALMRAAGTGDLKMTQRLFQMKGIDPNLKDSKGRTAQDYASDDGYITYARFKLQSF